jgi:hypothetical protein
MGAGERITAMLYNFDSIQDFARACEKITSRSYGSGETAWYGNESYHEAVQGCFKGDLSLVAKSDEFLAKVEAESIETLQPYWAHSVNGAFASVPDYLSNSPTPMRTRRKANSELSPVNIYVSTTCSGGISAETMTKRGLVALALLRKLETLRPVSLYLLAETHGNRDGICAIAVKLESSPIDLSVACFALAHVSFARHLTYSFAQAKEGFNGSWPDQYRYGSNDGGEEYKAFIRQHVGMNEQDIYIPPAWLHDPMLTTPVEWINTKLQEIGATE